MSTRLRRSQLPAQGSRAGNSLPGRNAVWSPDWPGLVSKVVLAAGTIAAYSRTFTVPLLFDDFGSISGNPSIHRLWPIWPVLTPPSNAGVGGRPLLNLSYALNYAFGGDAVFGYHLVNLVIHLLAGWTLFCLVRRTLRRPILAERFGSSATLLSLAVSAIWAWHPLLTQSVTYLSQRAESLMGLFYLLTIYCFSRGTEAEPKGSRIWLLLSFLACVAGVATKEVIATAPLLVLLYDRTFVSGSFSRAFRQRWPLYLALAATWIPLGLPMATLHDRGVGFGQGAAWWSYALVECRVIVRYLFLAYWPNRLVFDYGWYVAAGLPAVWPYMSALAALLVLAAIALRRWPAAGFCASWFLLILAPTSSVVPVYGQPMAESRLYLPLAGVAALTVLGAFSRVGRWCLPVFALVAVGLGLAAARRNRDYASDQSIWRDTVAKNPASPRAHYNLGVVLENSPEKLPEAIAQFEEALRLKPDYAEAHNNLGTAWLKIPGRLTDAIAQIEDAVRLKPGNAEAHNNLGFAYASIPGRLNEAIAQYEEAVRLKPDFAEAHYNLGNACLDAPGRLNDAIAQFKEAIRLRPGYPEACNNLGNAFLRIPGRSNDAIAQFKEAIRLRPHYPEAHNGLGAALVAEGRSSEAIEEFRKALQLNPDYIEARKNLEIVTQAPGR